jgi:hypothetical protein
MQQAVNNQYGLMWSQRATGLNGRSRLQARADPAGDALQLLMGSFDLSKVKFDYRKERRSQPDPLRAFLVE